MSKESEGRPYQAPRSQQETRQEAGHASQNRLPSLMHDEEAWSERSHEEMVHIIKSSMEQYREDRDPESRWFDPVDWMRDQLAFEMAKKSVAVNRGQVVDATDMPHAKLFLAWEIISLPYIRAQFKRDHVEASIHDSARILGRTITLDPNESKLLAAMAEACGLSFAGEQNKRHWFSLMGTAKR
jgi:hypothetical protein